MFKQKLIFLLLFVLFSLSSCYVGRFVIYNFADINDYKKFPSATISKPANTFFFKESGKGNKPDSVKWDNLTYKTEDFLKNNNSVAFLIIRNDTILYENYFDDYNANDIVPSFSASKSIVSALVGIAVGEGAIKSILQPITDYLPELKDPAFKKITIENLLNMRSGIKYTESYYNPFGNVAKGYYGRNLTKQLKTLKIKQDPDVAFDYISYNTQLLGFIVERATGKKLADYLEEKLWNPMGMEFDATWSLDSKKNNEAKAFCCLNARARDFAKFGRLYLNNGNWNGKQLIPETWVKKSTTIDKYSKDNFYSYQWWHNVKYTLISDTTKIDNDGTGRIITRQLQSGQNIKYLTEPQNDFLANGFLGQYIYVYPEKKIIIVRLGRNSNIYWPSFFLQLAKTL